MRYEEKRLACIDYCDMHDCDDCEIKKCGLQNTFRCGCGRAVEDLRENEIQQFHDAITHKSSVPSEETRELLKTIDDLKKSNDELRKSLVEATKALETMKTSTDGAILNLIEEKDRLHTRLDSYETALEIIIHALKES